MATTPTYAIPYVLPTDTVTSYPVTSLDLANRLDTLLGQALSDTGWRNVSSLLVSGWTGTLYLRRIGGTCHLRMHDLIVPGTFAQNLTGAPPAGFTPSQQTFGSVALNTYVPATVSGTTHSACLVQINGTAPAAGTKFRASWVFVTDDVWPTTLPGVPG